MAASAGEEAKRNEPLHVLFFPLLAHGHMIPLCDIARLFAAHGVKATIVTTPGNTPVFDKELMNGHNIHLELIKFPSEEVGLPEGIENLEDVQSVDVYDKFIDGIRLLRRPLEHLLPRLHPRPSCIVSDVCLPWTLEVAAEFGIPRLVFHGTGFFPLSVLNAVDEHKPFKAVESETEEFVVPGLPEEIRLTKSRLPSWFMKVEGDPALKLLEGAIEAEARSFGVIMNSFYELEADYTDFYEKVRGIRSWSVGPVSLSLHDRKTKDSTKRGKKAAIDEEECKKWLDSKPPNSVVYIAFGSITKMCLAQLQEIAMALDSLDLNFIWVVRRPIDATTDTNEDWLPSGFETRNKGKGLIIRGWSPQVMILDHEATGVFVTHCGWNSTLEGISSGVSLVTWPTFAEQFVNEKLITDIVKIGVSTGASHCKRDDEDDAVVGEEAIEAALRRVTEGEEAKEIRRRAMKMKEMAWSAIKEGGSSYKGLNELLEELRAFQAHGERHN